MRGRKPMSTPSQSCKARIVRWQFKTPHTRRTIRPFNSDSREIRSLNKFPSHISEIEAFKQIGTSQATKNSSHLPFEPTVENFGIRNRATQSVLVSSGQLKSVQGKGRLRISDNAHPKWQGKSLAIHFTILGDHAKIGVQQILIGSIHSTQFIQKSSDKTKNKAKVPKDDHEQMALDDILDFILHFRCVRANHD